MAAEPIRKLVLLRHAKSAWPEDVPDHDRPLGRRGRRDAPAAGRWLRLRGCAPDHVLCSTARRTRETWHLAESELGRRPPVTFEPEVYGASAGLLLEILHRLPSTASTVVVVGHDPGIPDLALALARMRAKFPTAAIAVLELSGTWSELAPGNARLASFVLPREMHDTLGTGHGGER
jgi:phosphohistidine phosphatase